MASFTPIVAFFKGIFFNRSFTYLVNYPLDAVLNKLDELFIDKKGLFESPNLVGAFDGFPHGFYLRPKWSPVIKNFEKDNAFLRGAIESINHEKTKITIKVRANSVYLILFVAFLIITVYYVFQLFRSQDYSFQNLLRISWLLFGCTALIFVARNASNRLRISFEEYMQIEPIKE